jgi:hypothetical protein
MRDSFFVSDTPVPREVKMQDGTTEILYFKELPMVDFAIYNEARLSEDEETRHASHAKLIAMSVYEADPNNPGGYAQSMSPQKARMLKPKMANAIMTEILSVNGYGAEEKKE